MAIQVDLQNALAAFERQLEALRVRNASIDATCPHCRCNGQLQRLPDPPAAVAGRVRPLPAHVEQHLCGLEPGVGAVLRRIEYVRRDIELERHRAGRAVRAECPNCHRIAVVTYPDSAAAPELHRQPAPSMRPRSLEDTWSALTARPTGGLSLIEQLRS